MKKIKWTRFPTMILVLIMVFALTSCGSTSTSSTASTGEKTGNADVATEDDSGNSVSTLNVGNYLNEVFIGSFDPTGAVAPGVCHGADYLVYDSLLVFDGEEYTSRILSDWEWVDGTTLEATIKDGVCFNNGDPMTAEDILYTYKTIREQSWMDIWYNFIDVENSVADGNKLTLKTKYEFALANYYLAYAGIVNKDAFESALDAAGGEYTAIDPFNVNFLEGMSSGPYICKEMTMDSNAIYELNKDWWGYEDYGDGMFQTINCYVYADQTTMAVDMETGKLDLALDCSLQDATRAGNGEMKDTALGTSSAYGTFYILTSACSENMKDVNVRRAVACLINPEETLFATYGDNYGSPSVSMVPQDCDCGYVEDSVIEEYFSYNPDRAAEYMAAAGVDPSSITLQILCDTTSANQNLAEVLQSELTAGGFGCEITVADTQSMDSYLNGSGAYDLLIQSVQDNATGTGYGCVMNLAGAIWPDFNYDADEKFMSLFTSCQQTQDSEELDANLQKLLAYGAEQVYWISLFEYENVFLYNPDVIDVDASYIPGTQFINLGNVYTK